MVPCVLIRTTLQGNLNSHNNGEQVMGIQTDQAIAPLCDLGSRQITIMGTTIIGIALASLLLFS